MRAGKDEDAVIFIGDDVSDESGFSFVNKLGGMSIRVKPRGETDARYALPDVAAVRQWIAEQVLPERRARKAG